MTADSPSETPPGETDEQRFAAFLAAQQRTLYKVAYIYCSDPESRRDLMQDMALQLWRAFPGFDGRAAASTWTWRLATNVAISHRRHERRRIRDTLPIDLAFNIADQSFADDTAPSRELRALVDTLDEMNRALVLFYLEGFDHAEIATLLGTTASNVGTRLNRIKTRLQDQLAPKLISTEE
jgi:RNA polymerase sigma factor (sigma-70 family)